MAHVKERHPDIVHRGKAIAVLDAPPDAAEAWVQWLETGSGIRLDWKLEWYNGRKLPHVKCQPFSAACDVEFMIRLLEMYAIRLDGELLCVAYPMSGTWRAPMPYIDAEPVHVYIEEYKPSCKHDALRPFSDGPFCPDCGEPLYQKIGD